MRSFRDVLLVEYFPPRWAQLLRGTPINLKWPPTYFQKIVFTSVLMNMNEEFSETGEPSINPINRATYIFSWTNLDPLFLMFNLKRSLWNIADQRRGKLFDIKLIVLHCLLPGPRVAKILLNLRKMNKISSQKFNFLCPVIFERLINSIKDPLGIFLGEEWIKTIYGVHRTTVRSVKLSWNIKCKMQRNAEKWREMQRNAEKCREMQRDSEIQRNAKECREMQRNTVKCREIQRNVEKWREM